MPWLINRGATAIIIAEKQTAPGANPRNCHMYRYMLPAYAGNIISDVFIYFMFALSIGYKHEL